MAIIVKGKTPCALCKKVIGADESIVTSSHFIRDEGDPLYPYSDNVMHQSCFLAWPLRDTFVMQFNATFGAITWGNGTFHEMQPDGRIDIKSRLSA